MRTGVISKLSDSPSSNFYRHAKVFDVYVYSATMETRQLARHTCSRISLEIELIAKLYQLHKLLACNYFQI